MRDLLTEELGKKSLREWGLEIEADPISLQSRILENPTIYKGNQEISCDERLLQNLPI